VPGPGDTKRETQFKQTKKQGSSDSIPLPCSQVQKKKNIKDP
jgi:hypothetical protein